jgi:hypothetical protein
MASVGSPDLIRCSGAGASTIRSQARQASLGRCVTITRYWAGITSSRSEVSSPITSIDCWQQGQLVSGGATVSWMRGKWTGSAPRLIRRFRSAAAVCTLSSIASALAIVCSIYSSARLSWSG